jgi:hypothetical protein
MPRRALIGALVLIVFGVALGATVFRTDIAQATGLAQSVTIDNTAANPVPVDEQGTVDVNVTNSSLSVTPQSATRTLTEAFEAPAGESEGDAFPAIKASLIAIAVIGGGGTAVVSEVVSGVVVRELDFPTLGGNLVLPLAQPLTVNRIRIDCVTTCGARFNIVGT